MGKIIGIDFGTSSSSVAVMEGGKPVVIPNAMGEFSVPSVVAVNNNGDWLVGSMAQKQVSLNYKNTAQGIRRKLGSSEKINIGNGSFRAEEIAARIITDLKLNAENYLGEQVTEAVVAVPVMFDIEQRQAVVAACEIAGLKVKRIISATTATALYEYFYNKDARKVMIVDIGGGSVDVSVLEIEDGVVETLASSGNSYLGGDDFNSYTLGANGSDSGKIDSMVSGFADLVGRYITEVLLESGLSETDLNSVLLVGRANRIPAVWNKIRNLTKQEPTTYRGTIECVALGTAIQSGILSGDSACKDLLIIEASAHSISIETLGGIATKVIKKNTNVPTKKNQMFSTAVDNQSAVDVFVYSGENAMAKQNKSLGNFRLSDIPPAKKGVPKIEVSFSLDVNGMLDVSAKNLATGKSQMITIAGASGMTESEIQIAAEKNLIFEQKARKNKAEILKYAALAKEKQAQAKEEAEKKPVFDEDVSFEAGKCLVCGCDLHEEDSFCEFCGFPVISFAGEFDANEEAKIKDAVLAYRKQFV